MHVAAHEAVTRFSADLGLNSLHGVGIDLGGRDVNGTVHALFPGVAWTVLDIEPHPSVDIVADVTTWEPVGTYDVALSTEAIEHIAAWPRIISAGFAVLKPGGYMIVTGGSTGRGPHSCNGVVPVPKGEHYGNVAPDDLERVAKEVGFSTIHVEYNPAPFFDVYLWAQKAPVVSCS